MDGTNRENKPGNTDSNHQRIRKEDGKGSHPSMASKPVSGSFFDPPGIFMGTGRALPGSRQSGTRDRRCPFFI
jgi:hypothetical protein